MTACRVCADVLSLRLVRTDRRILPDSVSVWVACPRCVGVPVGLPWLERVPVFTDEQFGGAA